MAEGTAPERQWLQARLSGLVCDTVGCDHREGIAASVDLASLIGKPCPKCGASLLTQDAHDRGVASLKKLELLNGLFEALIGKPKGEPQEKALKITASHLFSETKPASIKVETVVASDLDRKG